VVRNSFDTNISVNDEAYYGYYKPIENGMLFAGKPKERLLYEFFKDDLCQRFFLIAAIIYVICVVIAVFVSNSIAKRIKRASEQIVVLASGELGQELAGSAHPPFLSWSAYSF